MKEPQTNADFEGLSWHDCHVWGIELRAGDPDENDWTSELVLRLDFIVQWLCGVDGRFSFEIAPATLVFHDVTALRMAVDWSTAGLGAPAHDIAIHQIDRRQDPTHQGATPCYRWTIRTNWPAGGELTFLATGFTQTLLAEPVSSDRQHLSVRQRKSLMGQDGVVPRTDRMPPIER